MARLYETSPLLMAPDICPPLAARRNRQLSLHQEFGVEYLLLKDQLARPSEDMSMKLRIACCIFLALAIASPLFAANDKERCRTRQRC
jgi:hypothetical protein